MARSPYIPSAAATHEERVQIAFNCGRDLRPNDPRSNWIEEEPGEQEHQDLVDSYHEGQAQQFEDEDF